MVLLLLLHVVLFILAFAHECLSLLLHLHGLLLSHYFLLLLLHAHHFFLLTSLPLIFFFLDSALLLFLTAALCLLFLGSFGLLLGLQTLFSFGLGLSSGLSFSLISSIISGLITTFVAETKDLADVRSGIDASGSCLKHALEQVVGLFGLLSRHNLGRFDVDLFANHELCEGNELHQKVDFAVLFGDRFAVQLGTLVQAFSVASGLVGGREDVMQVSEGRLAEQFLRHLGLGKQLLVHLSGRLPEIVCHIDCFFYLF